MIHAKFRANQSNGLGGDQKRRFWQLKMTDGLQHAVLMLSTKRVPHDKESIFFPH